MFFVLTSLQRSQCLLFFTLIFRSQPLTAPCSLAFCIMGTYQPIKWRRRRKLEQRAGRAGVYVPVSYFCCCGLSSLVGRWVAWRRLWRQVWSLVFALSSAPTFCTGRAARGRPRTDSQPGHLLMATTPMRSHHRSHPGPWHPIAVFLLPNACMSRGDVGILVSDTILTHPSCASHAFSEPTAITAAPCCTPTLTFIPNVEDSPSQLTISAIWGTSKHGFPGPTGSRNETPELGLASWWLARLGTSGTCHPLLWFSLEFSLTVASPGHNLPPPGPCLTHCP